MEEYRKLENCENYEISNAGNCRNIITGRILKNSIGSTGYYEICLYGKKIRIHQLVAKHWCDNPNNHIAVDHINRDKLNNNVYNLRFVSAKENAINKTKRINSKSKYKGVGYRNDKKTWRPCIYINGKNHFFGSYKTEDEAYNARCDYIKNNNLSIYYI
jgi:hypothetical protein